MSVSLLVICNFAGSTLIIQQANNINVKLTFWSNFFIPGLSNFVNLQMIADVSQAQGDFIPLA